MADDIDARRRRTRTALHTAVLELAAERGPTDMSVTALATRAGVHRSTVYEHGTSPLDVLHRALAAELDQLRETHLRDISPTELGDGIRGVTLGVFAHVDRHAAIYRSLDEAAGATLHAFLSRHFYDSCRLLIAQSSIRVPFTVDGLDGETVDDAVARYISDGLVGLIAAWLRTPEPRDPGTPLALFAHLAPPWWPVADD